MKTQHSTCLLIPIIHLAIWGYNDKKNDLLPTFMKMYSTDLCCVFKMYWIVNFHFLLLKMRKRNEVFSLYYIQKVKVFSFRNCYCLCNAQLQTEVPVTHKKSLIYCLKTRILFRGRKKIRILRIKGKRRFNP